MLHDIMKHPEIKSQNVGDRNFTSPQHLPVLRRREERVFEEGYCATNPRNGLE